MHAKKPRIVQQNSISADGCLCSARTFSAVVSAWYCRMLKPLRTALSATDELMSAVAFVPLVIKNYALRLIFGELFHQHVASSFC